MAGINIPHTKASKYTVTDHDGNQVKCFVISLEYEAIERLRDKKDFLSCSLNAKLKTDNGKVLSEVIYNADLEDSDNDSLFYWGEFGKEYAAVGELSFDHIACDFQHELNLSK